jgi:hypothetical protein
MIPDGRMSRVRFEATTAPLCAFLSRSRRKPGVGIHPSSDRLRTASPRCSAAVFSPCHLDPAYLPVAWCAHRPFVGEVLPSHTRYYGLMCQSCCLPATMHGDSWLDLCRLDPPTAGHQDLPDVISAHLSLRAWTPTPAALAVHVPVTSRTTAAFPP